MSRIAPLCSKLAASVIVALFSSQLLAELTKTEGDESLEIYRMTVSPAAQPQPALKYHFLVPPVDQTHGNAATFYYKSMSFEGPDPIVAMWAALNDDEKYKAMVEDPLEKFPRQQAEKIVEWLTDGYFEWMCDAARCDYCDWEDDLRRHGVATRLPQAQNSRAVCNALAIRARLEIVQGKFDDAIKTLATGYAWSRNLDRGSTIIHSLIGMAFQGMLDEQTLELIASENSPNLYWALTDLSEHPINVRQALSNESHMWEFTVHGVEDLERRILSPEETLNLAKQIPNIIGNTGFQSPPLTLYWAVRLEPEARRYLLEHGFAAERLDAMPVLQVALLYRWRQFQIVRDNCFKYLQLPDSEIRAWILKSDETAKTAQRRGDGQPFTDLLPAIYASQYARLRSLRHTDMLRIIEALRVYAAEHAAWPEKLDDVKVLPIPMDPFTGKPFDYSVAGNMATLSVQPDSGGKFSARSGARRYELTLRNPSNK